MENLENLQVVGLIDNTNLLGVRLKRAQSLYRLVRFKPPHVLPHIFFINNLPGVVAMISIFPAFSQTPFTIRQTESIDEWLCSGNSIENLALYFRDFSDTKRIIENASVTFPNIAVLTLMVEDLRPDASVYFQHCRERMLLTPKQSFNWASSSNTSCLGFQIYIHCTSARGVEGRWQGVMQSASGDTWQRNANLCAKSSGVLLSIKYF